MYSYDIEKLIDEARKAAVKLLKEDRIAEAEGTLLQLLKVKPDDIPAMQLLAMTKQKDKKNEEAISILKQALAIKPNDTESLNNIAVAYSAVGAYKNAIISLEKALEIEQKPLFYNNLCTHYRQDDNLTKSLEMGLKALELTKDDSGIWANLGSTYGQMLRIDDAIRALTKAIELNPECIAPKVDLAFSHLIMGDWANGLPLYENRLKYFKQTEYFRKKYDDAKRWDGKKPYKNLIIYCEQGLGDIINFIRFVHFLPHKPKLEVPECLISLLSENGYDVAVDCSKEEHDYHCSLMSLPYFLGMKRNSIPNTSYLTTSKRIDLGYSDKFKIGIVWAGSPTHSNDHQRSCMLKDFEPLTKLTGVKIFSLQKDKRKRVRLPTNEVVDYTEGCEKMPIIDMADQIQDFSDTAAILKELDCLVTVDTSVLHLAGAMGIKTYALIPKNPDWRWRLNGEFTDWYPSVRLFRQTGDKLDLNELLDYLPNK